MGRLSEGWRKCPAGSSSATAFGNGFWYEKATSLSPPCAVQSPCSYMYAGACRLPFGDEPHHFLTPVLAE
jgi:hypothetical protein